MQTTKLGHFINNKRYSFYYISTCLSLAGCYDELNVDHLNQMRRSITFYDDRGIACQSVACFWSRSKERTLKALIWIVAFCFVQIWTVLVASVLLLGRVDGLAACIRWSVLLDHRINSCLSACLHVLYRADTFYLTASGLTENRWDRELK